MVMDTQLKNVKNVMDTDMLSLLARNVVAMVTIDVLHVLEPVAMNASIARVEVIKTVVGVMEQASMMASLAFHARVQGVKSAPVVVEGGMKNAPRAMAMAA